MLDFCSDCESNIFGASIYITGTRGRDIQLLGFSTAGTSSCWPSPWFTSPNVLPKSRPLNGSGLGLLCFSGDNDPVGSLVLVAISSVASSPSSALSYSGLLSLESLLFFPSISPLLFQKPLLRLPFPSRRHAGGLYLPPESEAAISDSVSERKPE